MIILSFIIWAYSFVQTEYIPPGTVKVGNYWVDKGEVSNIHWLEYLYYKGLELDSITLEQLKPEEENGFYKKTENRYQPITNLSYDQVIGYCVWRSKVVSEHSKRKVTYRLMTPEEWREIANILIEEDSSGIRKNISKSQKKSAHRKYYLELYNNESTKVSHFFTNVSEMTLIKGTSMGGNNGDLAELEEQLSKESSYLKPTNYLGFRCIAIVK